MKTLRIIGKAAVAFYDELFHYLLMGLVTLVAFTPAGLALTWIASILAEGEKVGGAVLIIGLVALLTLVPAAFALAGLYAVGQRAVRGEGVRWATYWGGLREFGGRSYLIALITVLGYVLVASNIWFYNTPDVSPFPPAVAAWVTPLWILVAAVWTGIAFYAEAFLVELEKPTLPIVLRNSLFLTALNPIPTLVWIVVSALALGLSVALPVLLVVSPAFVITLALTAVRTLVADAMDRAKASAPDDSETPDDAAPNPEEAHEVSSDANE